MRRSGLLFAALLVLAGCGGSGTAEEPTKATPADWMVVARASLRGIEGDASQRGAYTFTGPVVVTVELRRRGDNFRLVVDSTTEPYVVTFATATCDDFAKTDSVGETLHVQTGLPDQDSPQGGDPGAHNDVPIGAAVARSLVHRLPTVFSDAGGAHNPDYLFCGRLDAAGQ